MKEVLNNLFEYKSLNKDNAKEILKNLAQGAYNNSQVASFLTVYLMRSITVDELEGFREAMLELCIPIDLAAYDPIDLCGTGGDGKDTFNISTLSSFLVAAAGQPVAKHGNNSVSSVCGSSNILAHFGAKFSNDPGQLEKSIETSGICYLHAPLFHPAMKNVAPIRQELGKLRPEQRTPIQVAVSLEWPRTIERRRLIIQQFGWADFEQVVLYRLESNVAENLREHTLRLLTRDELGSAWQHQPNQAALLKLLPEQVDEYLREVVEPALAGRDADENADIRV